MPPPRKPAIEINPFVGFPASGVTASSVAASGRGRLGGQLGQQGLDLGLPESPVPAGGSDRTDPPGSGPARHGLGIDSEQSRNLARGQQSFADVGSSGQLSPPRSSTTPDSRTRCHIHSASSHLARRVLERLSGGKEVVRDKTTGSDRLTTPHPEPRKG